MPSITPTSGRCRGATRGNLNPLRHALSTGGSICVLPSQRQEPQAPPLGMTLVKGIALIRLFTRRLLESLAPDSDLYELAGTLRTIRLASSTGASMALLDILHLINLN